MVLALSNSNRPQVSQTSRPGARPLLRQYQAPDTGAIFFSCGTPRAPLLPRATRRGKPRFRGDTDSCSLRDLGIFLEPKARCALRITFAGRYRLNPASMRGSVTVAYAAHNRVVLGSTPSPAMRQPAVREHSSYNLISTPAHSIPFKTPRRRGLSAANFGYEILYT